MRPGHLEPNPQGGSAISGGSRTVGVQVVPEKGDPVTLTDEVSREAPRSRSAWPRAHDRGVALAAVIALVALLTLGPGNITGTTSSDREVQRLVTAPLLGQIEVDFGPSPAELASAVWPIPRATPLTDGFGWRDAIYGPDGSYVAGAQHHAGQDFAIAEGSPIVSVADGVVTESMRHSGLGEYIKIQHDGFESLYAHLVAGSRMVAAGEHVTAGQLIGDVGSTGASTGPHLHFEVHAAGVAVDPLVWLFENAR